MGAVVTAVLESSNVCTLYVCECCYRILRGRRKKHQQLAWKIGTMTVPKEDDDEETHLAKIFPLTFFTL